VARLAKSAGGLILAGSLIAITGFAAAQSYPNRPVRMIVPYPAGGSVDITARLLQAPLQQGLGQPLVIDNRSGASGMVGSDLVAKATPDGYSILMVFDNHGVNPAVMRHLSYDTERDFAPITLVGTFPLLFLVNQQVPARTLAEFVSYAKANAGKLNYASVGTGSMGHLSAEVFKPMAGIQMTHIPYRGGAPAIQAMLANETQLTLVSPVIASSFIQAGQLRPLAATSPQRSPVLPDLPTVSEQGYPGFEAVSWIGILTASGTPQPIIDRLHTEIVTVLRRPDIKKRLDELGMKVEASSPAELGKFVSAQVSKWTKVAKDNNIVAED
jgi:tripartite-type tricarboxylate transporter receptor subunit TctC